MGVTVTLHTLLMTHKYSIDTSRTYVSDRRFGSDGGTRLKGDWTTRGAWPAMPHPVFDKFNIR